MFHLKLFVFILVFCAQTSWSADFKMRGSNISMTLPAGWKVARNDGYQMFVVGPEANDLKGALMIFSTGRTKVKLDSGEMSRTIASYEFERAKYVGSKTGKVVEFLPYAKTKWDGIDESHSVGVAYEVAKLLHRESSYYINCNSKLYHLKTLDYPDRTPAQTSENLLKIVKSFKCRK